MELSKARDIADQVIERLRPHCERVQIAGSIRRGKERVKDIEIVASPLLYHEADLLGEQVTVNPFERYPWGYLGYVMKNGTRYKQIALAGFSGQVEAISLDLLIVLPPAQWGVIYTIRTGPAEFSHWCVTQRKKGGGLPSNCVVKDGGVHRVGDHRSPLQLIPMTEELEFLDFLGLGWVEPGERKPRW